MKLAFLGTVFGLLILLFQDVAIVVSAFIIPLAGYDFRCGCGRGERESLVAIARIQWTIKAGISAGPITY